MSTMATVGYGDATPIQIPEKIVSMFGMLVGVTVFAYIMSTVSSLLSTFNAQNLRAQETRQLLDSFYRSHKVPRNLAKKMSEYFEHVFTRRIHSDDMRLIMELPLSLRQQVRMPQPGAEYMLGIPLTMLQRCSAVLRLSQLNVALHVQGPHTLALYGPCCCAGVTDFVC
jgi:hypothetical protein